ncbi:MAG: hypothetical protein NW241_18055 [Bacteroidia bacterium]|nr:hypothetical protein [Bacteroidia bacterium]
MVFVRFIHPDLNQDSTYQQWLADRAAGEKPDWRDLFDWLGAHPRAAYPNDPVLSDCLAKCWFSEMWIGGRHAKDVEHFRPKNSGDQLSTRQSQALQQKLGYLPDQAPTFGGYTWLEYEPINYRLAHPHINRSGAKHTHFPLHQDSPRLSATQLPDFQQRVEYVYLLDPSDPRDQDLLLVLPDGSIVPRDPEGAKPVGDLHTIWDTPAMRNIRAWLSIIVYQLDHSDFNRGRRGVYTKTQEAIGALRRALEGNNRELVEMATLTLFRLGAGPSLFALAARSAMQAAIATLDPADPLEHALSQAIKALLNQYRQLENPSSIPA